MDYDVIGDIHGQQTKLEALLRELGYSRQGGNWRPPQDRQAIFLGDLIDRGPEQVKVVATVRGMIDAGNARSVMGNHEFNAIGYATPRKDTNGKDIDGEFLRRHSDKNMDQHVEFLHQVGEGSRLHEEMVDWFRTLPPALDMGGIRVVHAWWHQPHIDLVSNQCVAGSRMTDEFLHTSYDKSSPESQAMEGLTKGLELALPAGHSFFDHADVERFDIRTKWWHTHARNYRDIAIIDDEQRHRVPDAELPSDFSPGVVVGAPVFIGHYWMTGVPTLQTPKVACLDYSAARNGPLVAYRWNGEEELNASHFVVAG